MKKLGLSVAIAAAFVAAPAFALDNYAVASPAFVVPAAMYNASQFTAVGITNHSTASVAVYWSFHNVNSEHVTDGTLCLTGKDFQGFAWNEVTAGTGLADVPGYLLFGVGTGQPKADKNGACTDLAGVSDIINHTTLPKDYIPGQISANAFQVNSANKDVAVTPVVPLGADDFVKDAGLSTLNADSLRKAKYAAQLNATTASPAGEGKTLSLRYYRPTSGGTTIYIWSPNSIKGDYTANAYDDQQNRKSIQLPLPNKELNLVDPNKIVGMPSNFVDGFIEWTPSKTVAQCTDVKGTTACDYNGIFSYSVVSDSNFGAVQTLLNAVF